MVRSLRVLLLTLGYPTGHEPRRIFAGFHDPQQPSSIGSIDTERLAENPRFVSTARMPGVQTVVLDLSNIEYRPFAIW
jgi:hypothetical protein